MKILTHYTNWLIAIVTLASLSWSALTYSEEIPPYDRKAFGYGWIDADRDCQSTRNEVLIRDSMIPVEFDTEKRCKVKSGLWICPYTGQIVVDPDFLDIDHVVALREAWVSGAWKWTKEQRKLYANDLTNPKHLLAVYTGANISKRDRDPILWMPSNVAYWGDYVIIWVDIKQHWNLDIGPVEQHYIDKHLEQYEEQRNGIKF